MGQGLGKNTPVVLSLGRENYEALLNRHGQWTRWRQSNKCACVKEQTGQPDVHCKRCGGSGYVYSFQSSLIVQCVIMAKDTSGILILDNEYINDKLIKVYDRKGNEYTATKHGIYIKLDNSSIVKGSYYNIVMERNCLKTLSNAELIKDGNYWIVEGLEIGKTNIDGIFYKSNCDINSIESITDENDTIFEIEEFRQNKVLLKNSEIEPEGKLIAKNITYVEPYIFAILNQNLTKTDFQAMTEAQGDAIVTFPYYCDVAEGDVLTVLAGTNVQKNILSRSGSEYDILPAFFVSEITKIEGNDGTKYENGIDYILTGTNEIKWLTDYFETGEAYSVTYKVYPTYTVLKNIPNLRSSENQRFPKKAIVKFMSSYRNQRKVNQQ